MGTKGAAEPWLCPWLSTCDEGTPEWKSLTLIPAATVPDAAPAAANEALARVTRRSRWVMSLFSCRSYRSHASLELCV